MSIFRPLLFLTSLVACGSSLLAATVPVDLLGGIGDFESGDIFGWESSYAGADKDLGANCRWVDSSGGWGYSVPTPDDSLAAGWKRSTSTLVNPGKNLIFRISSGTGLNGSNCQYVALKNITSDQAAADIARTINEDEVRASVNVGDTVVFKLDYLKTDAFTGLPSGTNCTCILRIGGSAVSQIQETRVAVANTPISPEVSATISSAGYLAISVSLYTQGNLGNKQPGIYIDGAHLYAKAAGSTNYKTETIPIPKQHSIQTQNIFLNYKTSTKLAARNYDILAASEESYSLVKRVKYYNPAVKAYLYYSGATAVDASDTTGRPGAFKYSPMSFDEVRAQHPEWLYTGGTGKSGYVHMSSFSDRYYVHITNPEYQQLWADKAIATARKYGFDGIWIDDLVDSTETRSGGKLTGVGRPLSEVQSFASAVFPRLRAAGLGIVHNLCAYHTVPVTDDYKEKGLITFDPFWKPNGYFSQQTGYRANTPASVADSFFQEYGYFVARTNGNDYSHPEYWLQCVDDLSEIAKWNTAADQVTKQPLLAPTEKKSYHMWVAGVDQPSGPDPARGVDGWLQFGLCSYLLSQNQWTAVGFKTVGLGQPTGASAPYPDVDLTIATKLGSPASEHLPYNGDSYCRYRNYRANTSGGIGGVVVVNANPSVSRTYRVDFDAMDEAGNGIPSGTVITLKPHTGRILLNYANRVSVRLSVPATTVTPGQAVNITVEYANVSGMDVADFELRAQVPPQAEYMAGSAEASGGRFDAGQNSVIWQLSHLAAGESGTRTFKALIK